jgi:hypothetical protein
MCHTSCSLHLAEQPWCCSLCMNAAKTAHLTSICVCCWLLLVWLLQHGESHQEAHQQQGSHGYASL